MSEIQDAKSAARTLIVYLMVVVFACICSAMVVSQRLDMSRRGKMIGKLNQRVEQLKKQQPHLELTVAEKASYLNLLKKATEMKIQLVPPEQGRTEHEFDD
ncbi:MAG TPA: hypothetical protein VM141_00830 [Planctomycetota bacterium]|nr:hypothetical protein [Planctomycetota bacterium]